MKEPIIEEITLANLLRECDLYIGYRNGYLEDDSEYSYEQIHTLLRTYPGRKKLPKEDKEKIVLAIEKLENTR